MFTNKAALRLLNFCRVPETLHTSQMKTHKRINILSLLAQIGEQQTRPSDQSLLTFYSRG